MERPVRRALLRLCVAMGRTPRELGAAITSAELTELIAYGLIEPYGTERLMDGPRLLASLIYNSNRGSDQEVLMPGDFLQAYRPPEEADENSKLQALAAFLDKQAAPETVGQ